MSNDTNIYFHLENKAPTENLGVPRRKIISKWTITSDLDLVVTNKRKPANTVSISTVATLMNTYSSNQNVSSLTISSINGSVYPPAMTISPSLSVSTLRSRDYASTSCLSGISSIVSNNRTINFNANLMNFFISISNFSNTRTNNNYTSGSGIYNANTNISVFDTNIPRYLRITAIGSGKDGTSGNQPWSGAGGGGGGRVIYSTIANNYVISYDTNSSEDYPVNGGCRVVLSNIYTANILTLTAENGTSAQEATDPNEADIAGTGGQASGPPGSVATSGGNGGDSRPRIITYFTQLNTIGGDGGGVGGDNTGGDGGYFGEMDKETEGGVTNGQDGFPGTSYGDGGGGGGGYTIAPGPYGQITRGGFGGLGGGGGLPLIKFEWL